jgi:hypothetical protein
MSQPHLGLARAQTDNTLAAKRKRERDAVASPRGCMVSVARLAGGREEWLAMQLG